MIFCENTGDTVILPDPGDTTYGILDKGARHGSYYRQVQILAVNGACSITTASAGLSISAPAHPAVAALTTEEACGGFVASGQAVTLVSDGSKFRVVGAACGASSAGASSSSSTSSSTSSASSTSSLEDRVAMLEAVAAGGAFSYDVSFSLTVETSVDAATYAEEDVTALKTALTTLLGVSDSQISISVVAGSLLVTVRR